MEGEEEGGECGGEGETLKFTILISCMQIFLHLYIVGSGEKVQIGGGARQHHNKPSC